MTLQELRYLVALATHRHFRRAAEACHVSQPTLSIQIKKLEETLGLTLIERNGRVVELTPQGREVVTRARLILDEAQAIKDIAKRCAEPLAGPLHLGVIPTLGPYVLPWLIPALRERFPKLKLLPYEDLTAPLIEKLRVRRIGAALVSLPLDEDGFTQTPLFDEPFWAALPADHPLAIRDSVSDEDLIGQHLLVLTEGHCLRDQTLALYGDRPPAREGGESDLRASSLEAIRNYVALGLGISVLPALAAKAGARQSGVAIRPLVGVSGRRIGLIWRKSFPQAREMDRLGEAIAACLPPELQALQREEWLEAC
jgi:LysR family transcriptional regulator, hydrogen peroxide-inducible genes activator